MVSGAILLVVWGVCKSLEDQVRLEVVEDLVVSEVGVLWQVEDWLVLDLLIVLVVVDLDKSLFDEEHLLDITLVANYHLSGVLNSTEHIDDHLVGEASLTFFEKVVE